MENIKTQETKKKILPLVGVGILILVIAAVIILTRNKQEAAPVTPDQTNTGEQPTAPTNTEPGTPADMKSTSTPINPILIDAKREVPGTNLITTKGQVVTDIGEAVLNNVTTMDPRAPQQTMPVSKEQLSKDTIKVDISAAGYSPNYFTVNKGQAVTIALTSTDDYSHMLKFEDPSLSAVGTAVSSKETRAITFNAPTVAGEYKFFCDIPGHTARGEVGKMIVK